MRNGLRKRHLAELHRDERRQRAERVIAHTADVLERGPTPAELAEAEQACKRTPQPRQSRLILDA